MATPTTTAAGQQLGFLTIVQDPAGLIGGYLVTNLWGRPLEFRLTSPVQPNRVQQILYGDTLHSYLCGELIGKSLVDKATTPAVWVLTDQPAALDLRRRVAVPVSLWLPTARADQAVPLPGAEEGSGKARLDGAAASCAYGLAVGRGLFGHPSFPEDVGVVQEILAALGHFDLGEPFQRIREAIGEARRMGVGKAAA
ncbi:MAG: hypothetical protein NZO58_01475 [Gemmataceae bacterium]|nr:hypothetical protein [Gemmataceae bacterium]